MRRKLFVAMNAGLLAAAVALRKAQTGMSVVDDTQSMKVMSHVFNQRREICYASSSCPNLDELMDLFTPDAKRTEINRSNNVVQLQGAEAIREDSLRVARTFSGRRLQTFATFTHGRNVAFLQWNWDPGSPAPNPFIHVLRMEDGRIAHWILVAP